MIKVTYYPKNLGEPTVTDYLPVLNSGYAGQKAKQRLVDIFTESKAERWTNSLPELCEELNRASPPIVVVVEKDGRWDRVVGMEW